MVPAAPPLIRLGRAFLGISRKDLLAVLLLVAVASTLRLASPIFPNWLSHPFQGPPVTAWGLGFPLNSGGCQPDVPSGPHFAPQRECGFVFDEVYFPVDAAKDIAGQDYFDPEPPLSKLLMTPPQVLWGQNLRLLALIGLYLLAAVVGLLVALLRKRWWAVVPSVAGGVALAAPLLMAYLAPVTQITFTSWTWRLSPAIAGSLTVGLVYLIAMRLWPNRFFATCASIFYCFDGLAFVEARTGVIDAIAIFWAAFVFYAFLLHWQARTRTQWHATLYFFATIAGLGLAAKLTALAPIVLAIAFIAARWVEPALMTVKPFNRLLVNNPASQLWREAALSAKQPILPGVLAVIAATVLALASNSHLFLTAVLLLAAGVVLLIVSLLREGRFDKPDFRRFAAAHGVLYYIFAASLVVSILFASYSRYLTIQHSVYHFTTCDQASGLQATTVIDKPPKLIAVGPLRLPSATDMWAVVGDQLQSSLVYHATECHSHPWASRWYTWPVFSHPVLFYADYSSFLNPVSKADDPAWITDMGNPAVWWLAIPALIYCAWKATYGPKLLRTLILALGGLSLLLMIVQFHNAEMPDAISVRVHPGPMFIVGAVGVAAFAAVLGLGGVLLRRTVPAFIVLGYLVAWLMWMPGNEQRVLFFYHMLGALLFAVLALAYALSKMRGHRIRITDGWSFPLSAVSYGVVGLVIASFIFFYPYWTGMPLSSASHDIRIWLEGWA